jgi:Bacterial membrane protein YfhO
VSDAAGLRWYDDDWQQWLGVGCDAAGRTSFAVSLPRPVKSTGLGVVSRLACSTAVTDGTEVARLRIIDANEQVSTRSMVAGRDTSEWAYDCPNVRPAMRHSRATVFSTYAAKMYEQSCPGHFYITKLNLDGLKEIKRLEFEWTKNPASLIIEKLSLIDDRSGGSYPLDLAFTQPQRWRLVEETAAARVYENLRVLPRVWLTHETVTVTAAEALQAIKSGTLKDGRAFDAHQTALIEEPVNFASSQVDARASATITSLRDTRMEVQTNSSSPTLLVTSDAYYPGWRATIDGQETRLYRADYALRGVILPPGQHLVAFSFRPTSFYAGAILSMCSIVTLVAMVVWWRPPPHK